MIVSRPNLRVEPNNVLSGTRVARNQSTGAVVPARLPPTRAIDARYAPLVLSTYGNRCSVAVGMPMRSDRIASSAGSAKSWYFSTRCCCIAAAGITTEGYARIVPSLVNTTVRAPSSGARPIDADSASTSKSIVNTAASAPSVPYNGSVTVSPVLCDDENVCGSIHARCFWSIATL